MAIQSFKCSETQDLFNLQRVRRWVNVEVVTLRKLRMLHAGSMPFRVELDSIKDIGVPVQSAAVSPVAVD